MAGNDRQTGVVKWFDARKGIGFIQRTGAPDVFVHFTQIISAQRSFDKGESVEFSVQDSARGPKAKDVIRI